MSSFAMLAVATITLLMIQHASAQGEGTIIVMPEGRDEYSVSFDQALVMECWDWDDRPIEWVKDTTSLVDGGRYAIREYRSRENRRTVQKLKLEARDMRPEDAGDYYCRTTDEPIREDKIVVTVRTPCDSEPCMNGATCVNLAALVFECQCPAGYSGELCEIAPDPCATSPCGAGGTCTSSGSDYTCDCPPGYLFYDGTCMMDPCTTSPCGAGGTCTSSGLDYTCDCPPGYLFHDGTCMMERLIERACTAAENECANGECMVMEEEITGDVRSRTCSCPKGYSGDTCATVCDPSPCENGAVCQPLPDDLYECLCEPGYHGIYCQIDFNECLSEPCQNGGTCTDGLNSFTCTCPTLVTGPLCSEHITTTDCPVAMNPCQNGATCDYDVLMQRTRCYCPDNYMGDNCTMHETRECTEEENKCKNGANCVYDEVDKTTTCKCRQGYTGDHCEDTDDGSMIWVFFLPVLLLILLIVFGLILFFACKKCQNEEDEEQPKKKSYELKEVTKPAEKEKMLK